MSDNKIVLTVIVGGDPYSVEVNLNAPLRTLIPKALHESGHVGQPPENWILTDWNGNALDLDKKIEEYGFTTETKLRLSPNSGVAG